MGGKVTQSCWGNEKMCWGSDTSCWGSDSSCWGNEAILLGKRSKLLGKWSNFVGEVTQKSLGRCPKYKVQHTRGIDIAFSFLFSFTLRDLCIGLKEVLPHTSRRICDWELLLSSHIFFQHDTPTQFCKFHISYFSLNKYPLNQVAPLALFGNLVTRLHHIHVQHPHHYR